MAETEPDKRGVFDKFKAAASVVLTLATGALLLLSVALNVVQARRLGVIADPPRSEPSLGSLAPPLGLKSLDGKSVDIRFDGRQTILYYFSPTCGWCEKNWPNVGALAAGSRGGLRLIGISASKDLSAFLRTHQNPFDELYVDPSAETIRRYHFGGTPDTVAVSADGRIAHVWPGAYTGGELQEVEHAFHVSLPGVISPPRPAR